MGFYSRKELKKLGFASIGENEKVSRSVSFHGAGGISIGDNSRNDDFCVFSAGEGGIVIGHHVHIAVMCSLIGKGSITICDLSTLSGRVSIYSSSDDHSGPFMTNPNIPAELTSVDHRPVSIGRHVIVGRASVVLPGTVIEDGVAIGAMSLVKGVLRACTICAGVHSLILAGGCRQGSPQARYAPRAMQLTMFVNAPAMLGLAAVVELLVIEVFGEVWRPAVPILRILCLGGVLIPLHTLNLQAPMALGRSTLFFRLDILKKALGIVILAVSSFFGPEGMAWGMVAASALSLIINTRYAEGLIGYGIAVQLRDVLPAIAIAVEMVVAVSALAYEVSTWPSPARLVAEVAAGATMFIVTATALRLPAYREIRALISASPTR